MGLIYIFIYFILILNVILNVQFNFSQCPGGDVDALAVKVCKDQYHITDKSPNIVTIKFCSEHMTTKDTHTHTHTHSTGN